MNVKIDIYELADFGKPNSQVVYYGSLSGQTDKSMKQLIDYFHKGGNRKYCLEGLMIKSYEFEEIGIIELTGIMFSGEWLTKLAKGSKGLNLKRNNLLEEYTFQNNDKSEFIFIENNADVCKVSWKNELRFLPTNQVAIIDNINVYEWGASGLFENFIINILSNFSSTLIEKIVSIGIPSNSITKFRLPSEIKKKIAKEYNIEPNSLFLISYIKRDTIEYIEFRNIHFKMFLEINNGELESLQVDELNINCL